MGEVDDLRGRIERLERGRLGLDDLPLANLQQWFVDNREQQASQDAILPHSVRENAIGMLPFAIVERTANLAIANGANTAVPWQQAQGSAAAGNPYGMWNAATPTRVTATRAGWCLAIAQVQWGSSAGGSRRMLEIYKNGALDGTAWRDEDGSAQDVNLFPSNHAHGWFSLAVGDYLECNVWQDSGGALDIFGGTNDPSRAKFTVVWQHHNVAPTLPA